MVRPAAAAAAYGGVGALAILLWAALRIRRQHHQQQNTASEASLPAAAVSARELRRRVRRYGNTFPEADVPSYPLLGHALNLTKVHKIAKRIGSVFNMHVFVIETLIVTGPENLRPIFINTDTFHGAWPDRWIDLLGHGAVSSVEKDHRRIRGILNTGISKATISACHARVYELAKEKLLTISNAGVPVTKWGPFPWSGSKQIKGVEVLTYMRQFTFDVISVFIAGADPAHEAQLAACRGDIETLSAGMGDLIFPSALSFTPFNKGMQARERAARVIGRMIKNRRERQDAGESFHDVLGNLINGRLSDGGLMTDSEICDNIILMLFAGYDTTSALLTTSLHYLTRELSPKDRAGLQAEIDGVRLVDGDPPSEEVLQSLPVLDAFMKETQRIKAPITGPFKKAVKDTELPGGGGTIKGGTIIRAMIGPTMLDDALFPDPETFDMSRFLPGGSAESAPAYAFLPFGAGPRMCLGFNLAKLEFKVFLFQLLRYYNVEPGTAPSVPKSFPVQKILSSVYLTKRET